MTFSAHFALILDRRANSPPAFGYHRQDLFVVTPLIDLVYFGLTYSWQFDFQREKWTYWHHLKLILSRLVTRAIYGRSAPLDMPLVLLLISVWKAFRQLATLKGREIHKIEQWRCWLYYLQHLDLLHHVWARVKQEVATLLEQMKWMRPE